MSQNSALYTGRDPVTGDPSDVHRLAQLVAIFGSPPVEFLSRSETSSEFFNHQNKIRCDFSLPSTTLEEMEKRMEGDDRIAFLAFIRRTMQWEPEKRPTAADLLNDPWLQL